MEAKKLSKKLDTLNIFSTEQLVEIFSLTIDQVQMAAEEGVISFSPKAVRQIVKENLRLYAHDVFYGACDEKV